MAKLTEHPVDPSLEKHCLPACYLARPLTQERTPLFDNARALLIVLVVVGHAWEALLSREPLARGLYSALYLFHIPAFAWLSGHLSSPKLDGKALRSIATSLLLPLVLFQLLYCAFDVWVRGLPFTWAWLYTPNWILWFLLSLIWWRLLLPLVLKLPFPLVAALALSVAAGAWSFIGYPLSLSRTLVFFPFFVAGHLWPRAQVTAALRRPRRMLAVLVFAALAGWAAAIALGAVASPDTRWLYGSSSYAELGVESWRGALIRLALFTSALVCVASFIALCPRGQSKLTELGAVSLAPFLLHGFVIRAARHFGFFAWMHDRIGLHSVAAAIVGSLLLALLLSSAPIVRATEPLWNPGRFFSRRVVQPKRS